MRLKPIILAFFILCFTSSGLTEENPGGYHQGHQEPDLHSLKSKKIELRCLGKNYQLQAFTNNGTDLPMIFADDKALPKIAKSFAMELTYDDQAQQLSAPNYPSLKLKAKQARLPDTSKGLELCPRPFSHQGRLVMPLSALEVLLLGRIHESSKDIYLIEPILTDITSEQQGDKIKLSLWTSAPIQAKTFFLKKPDRLVIDLPSTRSGLTFKERHIESLGKVRVGQFTLAPSTTRVVIPCGKISQLKPTTSHHGLRQHFTLPTQIHQPTPEKAPEEKLKDGKTVKIHGITVKEYDDYTDIIVLSDHPAPLKWTQLKAPDNRFILDLQSSILLSNKFSHQPKKGPCQGVRASQFTAGENPSVRMVIEANNFQSVQILPSKNQNTRLRVHRKTVHSIDTRNSNTSTSVTPPSVTPRPFRRTIVLDPGHGGSDPGAINSEFGVTEKEITLQLADLLEQELKAKGWSVTLTRNSDCDVTHSQATAKEELGARADIANHIEADLFLSLHVNAAASPTTQGTSLHVFKPEDTEFAKYLYEPLLSATQRPDRGIVKNRFYVLAQAAMPSVLIETAFLTNREEALLLQDKNYLKGIARALAQGCEDYAKAMKVFPQKEPKG